MTGCSVASTEQQPPEDTTAVVYVIQNGGSNSPKLSMNESEVLLQNFPFTNGSSVTVILADGTAKAYGPSIYENNGKNPAQVQKQHDAYLNDVATALTELEVDADESDLFGSLQLASRSLASSKAKNKMLILACPAVNTCEPLTMQNSDTLFLQDPASVAAELASEGQHPSLSDTSVQWFYSNDFAGTQDQLSSTQIQWLTQFWSSVLEECGATSIDFPSNIHTGTPTSSSPYKISSVPPEEISFQFDETLPLSSDSSSSVIVLDEMDSITFVPDEVVYQDAAKASTLLDKLAKTLATSDTKYLVAGSTAAVEGSTISSSQDFSLRRAATVQRDLISRGIAEDRLIPVGLGMANWSGRSSTDEALNRAVYLIPSSNPAYQEVLNVGKMEG